MIISVSRTCDLFDYLFPDTSCRGTFELQGKLTQVPEVGAAFDNQYVSVVFFSAQDTLLEIIVLP